MSARKTVRNIRKFTRHASLSVPGMGLPMKVSNSFRKAKKNVQNRKDRANRLRQFRASVKK